MGWNQVTTQCGSRHLAGISPSTYFYFAHSFAALDSHGAAAATCSYGAEFTAVIEQHNIFAVQFHPEKSGDPGARVLQNFLRLAA
jgi:imidazole glycerol-phosphate synthase subunit HisH